MNPVRVDDANNGGDYSEIELHEDGHSIALAIYTRWDDLTKAVAAANEGCLCEASIEVTAAELRSLRSRIDEVLAKFDATARSEEGEPK